MMNPKGQSTIELTFVMVAVMFLIFGMVMLFRWAGMDLANRRVAQDQSLTILLNADMDDPAYQLNVQTAGDVLPLSAVYHGQIADGNGAQ